jgi:hypothetical protein
MKYISLKNRLKVTVLLISLSALPACEEYLEIPAPTNSVTGETVFLNKGTIDKLMNNMYYNWANASGIVLQYTRSAEFFSDNAYNPTGISFYPEMTGELTPESSAMSAGLWAIWYTTVYGANLILEGLPDAPGITDETLRNAYMGAALTIRAGAHYYLARTFGDVPINLTTDVDENSFKPRMPVAEVYAQVIADLNEAMTLLPETSAGNKRYIDNKYIPQALLARVYTTMGNWAAAETAANAVIASGKYQLLTNLADVFYRPSQEVISSLGNTWAFSATYQNRTLTGLGFDPVNTSGQNSYPALSEDLLNSFETGDNRKTVWVNLENSGGYSNPNNRYFSLKYLNTAVPVVAGKEQDYVLIRLAEMYLIRAEARARQNNLTGATSDLNAIRNRAGLANTTATTQTDLINAIIKERRVEFFHEGGYRWDDLVRTGTADAVLSALPWKINWDSYKTLWPIPMAQVRLNSNLEQNPGYDTE